MAEFTPNKFEPIKGVHRIEKVDYRRWALDKNLQILGRQNYVLADLVQALKDYKQPWKENARQSMTYPLKMDKHITVYLLDNGVDAFVLLVDDMQGNSYNRNQFEVTGEQQIVVFLVSENA